MSAIQDAINAAKNAAANVPAEVNNNTTAVAPAARAGAPLTLDQMLVGGMSVDAWLKVNQYGLFVGNDPTPFQTIDLVLDMSEVQYNFSIKFGNPAQYLKTYDQATCITGGSWAQAQAKAQAVDPNSREYRSADIPFMTAVDLKKPDGTVVLEAGKRLGHGLSTTGWKAFGEFVKSLKNQNIDPNTASVKVTLGFTPQSNPKGKWGVLRFVSAELAGE